MKRRVRRAALAAVVIVASAVAGVVAAGCGKKGPPLPPLVKLPVAPTDVAATRRGSAVDVAVTMPASNTDGTRPANIARVDVYAITGPLGLASEDVLIKYGTKIGSVAVKTPRDPNQTVDVDDPDSDIEPPEGRGLDQGATTHVREMGPGIWSSIKPSIPPPVPVTSSVPPPVVPLVGPPLTPPLRQFFAVGFNNRGRRGPISRRVAIPLIEAPATPPAVDVTYNESTITVAWRAASVPAAIGDGRLPSRSLVGMRTTNGYNVYTVDASPDGDPVKVKEAKLTTAPLDDLPFLDERFEWGAARCYVVRAVALVAGLAVESDGRSSACVTPIDTFPPAAPKQPTAIAVSGAINLLWDANEEKDLAGYIVLRANAPGERLTALTPAPIDATNFTDTVPSNTRAVYAIEAVDRAGNVSPMSPLSDEETAR